MKIGQGQERFLAGLLIALGAGIPVLLYGLDYEKKLIRCTRSFIPSGDVEGDMQEIKSYFKDFKGKKPEQFVL